MGVRSLVCVRRLMADSEDMMHEFFILLKVSSRGYLTDKNIKQMCKTYEKLLHNLDNAFSYLCQVELKHERIIEAGDFVDASMETWRNLGLSVTPKAQIFEDHAVEFVQYL